MQPNSERLPLLLSRSLLTESLPARRAVRRSGRAARRPPRARGPRQMNHPILNDPRWWSALTLAERRATLAVADAATRSRGERRLRRWRTEKDVTGGVEVTLSRWLDSGLSEEALAGLLGEGPEQLHPRLPALPEGLRSPAEAWRRLGAGPAVSELVDGDAVRPANPELTELAGPLLRRALSTLADQVEAAARDANFGADLRPDHPVLRLPLPRISQLVTRVVV